MLSLPGVLARGDDQPDPPAGPGRRAGQRAERALVLLLLASRAAVCLYAASVAAINTSAYRRPGLAVAAVLVALAASTVEGVIVWRRQAVGAVTAVTDTMAAAAVLLALSAAIRPLDRMGSLNWALAYSVSCASWLALGRLRWWRACLASLLGAIYGVSVLAGGGPAATTITAVVNAVSPPLYFAIAAALFHVLRRIARAIDADLQTERRQRGESACLRERERLYRELHPPVLAVLDAIAFGTATDAELRARASAEAAALRQAFADPQQVPARGLTTGLASAIADRVGTGWTVRLVDEEMAAEPPPGVSQALSQAVAGLLGEASAAHPPGQIRIQVRCDDSGTSIVVRITGCAELGESAVDRARTCLAAVAGTASLRPALSGERRVMLWTPP
jgi:hypothetical protein